MLKSKKFIMVSVLAMAMMLAGVTSAFAATPDSWESNDSPATATAIGQGWGINGNIHSSTDIDYYTWTVTSTNPTGLLYLAPPGNGLTYQLWLYDRTANVWLYNGSSTTTALRFDYAQVLGHSYHAVVLVSNSGFSDNSYSLVTGSY